MALNELPELAYSVSATTREPREDEVDGKDYMFLTREKFEQWIEEDEFLEWAEYSGNLYGTPGHRVDALLDDGRYVILEIELQGARIVRQKRPDAAMVFVRAPSLEENRRRLEDRATETSGALESRMTTAVQEVAARDEFDYEVVNGERGQARRDMLETVRRIIEGDSVAE
ncbi:hypothetical protein BH23ACT11_BH23ACT11_03410 [soil metagenome]